MAKVSNVKNTNRHMKRARVANAEDCAGARDLKNAGSRMGAKGSKDSAYVGSRSRHRFDTRAQEELFQDFYLVLGIPPENQLRSPMATRSIVRPASKARKQKYNPNAFGNFTDEQCTRAAKQLWEYVFPAIPWPDDLIVFWDSRMPRNSRIHGASLADTLCGCIGEAVRSGRRTVIKRHASSCRRIWRFNRIRLNSRLFINPPAWVQSTEEYRYECPFGPWVSLIHEFLHVLNPGDNHSDSFWQTLQTILDDILPVEDNGDVDEKAA